jgi:hypothetical protein
MFFADPEAHLTYKAANAPLALYPFPHIYVRDVFPEDFYRELRRHLPPPASLRSLTELGRVGAGYPAGRSVLQLTRDDIGRLDEPYRSFWMKTGEWLVAGGFGLTMLQKFGALLAQRFPNPGAIDFYNEALVIRDETKYALGPHTDSPSKVLSCLFYLPADDSRAHLGTSMYVPKDPSLTSTGAEAYHPFDRFKRLATMPYVPNTLFAFMKTPVAFHGVEPIVDENPERSLLLFDIRHGSEEPKPRPAPAPQPAAGGASTKFSF